MSVRMPRSPRGRYLAQSSWSAAVPRVYSFQDVAEAIAVHELLDLGVQHGDIKAAIADLRAKHGDWPLSTTPDLGAIGSRVVRRHGDRAEAVGRQSGQGYLEASELVAISSLLRRGGWVVKDAQDIQHIEVDPDRLSGHPTIKNRRIAAEYVAQVAAEPDGRTILRVDFGLTTAEIRDAARWHHLATELERSAA